MYRGGKVEDVRLIQEMQVHRRSTTRTGPAAGRTRVIAVRPVAQAPPSGQRDVSAASAAGAVFAPQPQQPPPPRANKQSLLRVLEKASLVSLNIMPVDMLPASCQRLRLFWLCRVKSLPFLCLKEPGVGLLLETQLNIVRRAACGELLTG